MILIGASGHAKVIASILEEQGEQLSYLVDTDPSVTSLLNYQVIGQKEFVPSSESVIISIGSNTIRKKLAKQWSLKFGRAIHPTVVVDKRVDVGEGTVIMAGVVINSSTKIGNHCIINTSASIDHDCEVGDFVHVSPGARVCGGITVGEGTHIGAGATIIPNIKIGKWAIIGAGAVIIKDVPDFAVVVGNPGRIIKRSDGER